MNNIIRSGIVENQQENCNGSLDSGVSFEVNNQSNDLIETEVVSFESDTQAPDTFQYLANTSGLPSLKNSSNDIVKTLEIPNFTKFNSEKVFNEAMNALKSTVPDSNVDLNFNSVNSFEINRNGFSIQNSKRGTISSLNNKACNLNRTLEINTSKPTSSSSSKILSSVPKVLGDDLNSEYPMQAICNNSTLIQNLRQSSGSSIFPTTNVLPNVFISQFSEKQMNLNGSSLRTAKYPNVIKLNDYFNLNPSLNQLNYLPTYSSENLTNKNKVQNVCELINTGKNEKIVVQVIHDKPYSECVSLDCNNYNLESNTSGLVNTYFFVIQSLFF